LAFLSEVLLLILLMVQLFFKIGLSQRGTTPETVMDAASFVLDGKDLKSCVFQNVYET